MEIQFQYSLAWLWLIIPLSGYIAFWLYKGNSKITGGVKWGLATIRFIAFLFLGVLILKPSIQTKSVDPVPPLVVVLQDASASMLNFKDSSEVQNKLLKFLAEMQSDQTQIDWANHSFGARLKPGFDTSFTEGETNLATALQDLSSQYAARKPAAVFLVSDGNINRGMNPKLIASELPFPIHSISIGDTNRYPDVRISNLRHNEVAYLGNTFPLEVQWSSDLVQSSTKLNVRVLKGGEQIASKDIEMKASEQLAGKLVFNIEADAVGIQEYQVKVDALDGEVNVKNNQSKFRLEVLDSRKKILLLAKAPHPDLSAIKQAVQEKENQEIEIKLISEQPISLDPFALVILHDLPDRNGKFNPWLPELGETRLPLWYIIGPKVDFNGLNKLQSILSITTSQLGVDEVFPAFVNEFTAFDLSPEEITQLEGLPPLQAPYGTYRAKANAKVLAHQRIGSVRTDRPLFLFGEDDGGLRGITAGTGLWKWRMVNFAQTGDHNAVDELINKTIQFLSADANKERFRLRIPRSISGRNQGVVEAYLYNQAFEPVNEPEVSVELSGPNEATYPLTMSRQGNHYRLKLPVLPEGAYSFRAKTELGGEPFEKSGGFSVQGATLEQGSIVANHGLLKELADLTGGEVFQGLDQEALSLALNERPEFKPVLRAKLAMNQWVDLSWWLLLPLLLLSLEWILRKWLGTY